MKSTHVVCPKPTYVYETSGKLTPQIVVDQILSRCPEMSRTACMLISLIVGIGLGIGTEIGHLYSRNSLTISGIIVASIFAILQTIMVAFIVFHVIRCIATLCSRRAQSILFMATTKVIECKILQVPTIIVTSIPGLTFFLAARARILYEIQRPRVHVDIVLFLAAIVALPLGILSAVLAIVGQNPGVMINAGGLALLVGSLTIGCIIAALGANDALGDITGIEDQKLSAELREAIIPKALDTMTGIITKRREENKLFTIMGFQLTAKLGAVFVATISASAVSIIGRLL